MRPADRVFRGRVLPGVRANFAIRKADFACFLVELVDAHLHLLVYFEHFAGMLHAVPTELADVNEAVQATKVDECLASP